MATYQWPKRDPYYEGRARGLARFLVESSEKGRAFLCNEDFFFLKRYLRAPYQFARKGVPPGPWLDEGWFVSTPSGLRLVGMSRMVDPGHVVFAQQLEPGQAQIRLPV